MADPSGYSIQGYGRLIADDVRTGAYAEALRRTVRPGCAVLDLGAGTGILSLLACQYGAGRVYAVEPDDAILLAQQIAAANGYADRITFIQDISTRITLPERADVIVYDLRGVLPLHEGIVASIKDARARHLAPGGQLIPQRETLWVAVVETLEHYQHMAGPWADRPYGLDMSAARDIAINAWARVPLEPKHLLSEPLSWVTLDYGTIESPNVRADVSLTVSRPGTGHGLALWFASELVPGVGFSSAPDQPKVIYRQAFFPWTWPVELAAGDQVTVHLDAHLVSSEYVWRWDTRVAGREAGAAPRANFRQSTFFGLPLSADRFRMHEASYTPVLNEDGLLERFTLGLMNGDAALAHIAQRLAQEFPDRFAAPEDALSYAVELCEKVSR